MNFLSRLLPRSGPSERRNIVTLSPGEFSIIRSEDSPKGRRELIFKEAEIHLVTTTREFFLQLQVRDLNDEDAEGDASNAGEEDELVALEKEEGNTFLVHPDLKLGYYLNNGRVAIAWKDTECDEDRYEFLCSESIPKESLDVFDRTACEAQYGQKYGKKPPASLPESAFDEFTYDYSTNAPKKVNESDDKEPAATNASTEREKLVVKLGREFSEGRTVMSAECDLCAYDSVQDVFVSPKSLQGVTVVVLDQNNYEYFLEVRDAKRAILGTPIHANLNQYIDLSNKALIFNYEGDNNVIMSYLLRLRDQESLHKLENAIAIAQYESTNHSRWTDISEEQQDFLVDAMNGFHMKEEDNSDSLEEENDEEENEDDIDVETEDPTAASSNEKNSALEVGHTNDRTYVVRGNKIGVFKNTDKNLQYSTTIENLDIDPSRILLHEQDRTLVIQAKDDNNNLFRMDLETGKIVDEWDFGKPVNDFNPISKLAPTTAESNLFGVGNQSLFRIDPRIHGGKITTEKTYSSRLGLTNVVTTEAGHLAVGNKKGELRLYDKMGKVAKTLIPGLGDPFIGLDVTSDGRYVLATTERYLLLIQTASSKYNGFLKAGSGDLRPRPIKLSISPENVVFMNQQTGKPIRFTAARFNTGLNAKEATIVTSTGPYLVIWSLYRVLRGETNAYRIKKYGSQITAEDFKFGTDQRVILTLEDDVNMVAKSALKSPNAVFKSEK